MPKAEPVIDDLKKLIKDHGSQKATAAALGVSTSYLSDILAGRRDPGPYVLHILGYRRVTTYRKIKQEAK